MLPLSHLPCPSCSAPTDRAIVVHGLVVALDCRECLCKSADKMRPFVQIAPFRPQIPAP